MATARNDSTGAANAVEAQPVTATASTSAVAGVSASAAAAPPSSISSGAAAPAGSSGAGVPVDLRLAEVSRLVDVPLREVVELVHIDLPAEQMEPLLERGVLPGCRLCPIRKTPFGDPIVEVEGTLLALRRETASCLCVRQRMDAA